RTTTRAPAPRSPRTRRSHARRSRAARSPARRTREAAGSAAPPGGSSRWRAPLGLEVVRVVRQHLRPVLGHEHEVLEAAAAVAVPVEARLDRDHVAGDELARRAAERRLLVHLEPDPVAERVVEAVLEHLAGLLRAQRRVTVLLEDVARDLE